MTIWQRQKQKVAGYKNIRQRQRERNRMSRELSASQRAAITKVLNRQPNSTQEK